MKIYAVKSVEWESKTEELLTSSLDRRKQIACLTAKFMSILDPLLWNILLVGFSNLEI